MSDRVLNAGRKDLSQAPPVELAGQAVVTRKKIKLALMLVAFGDDAQHAMGARRACIGAGKPAAGVLDPKLGVGGGIGS